MSQPVVRVSGVVGTRDSVSHAEVLDWLTDHPDIRRYVGMTKKYQSRIDMKPSVFAYALWRLHAINEPDATAFLAAIVMVLAVTTEFLSR